MECRFLPQVKEALKILGIGNFLLGIHDTAFPGLQKEDLGSGSPYSLGAARFLRFARDLGFNGIQLGPQGITTPANPSPYDGSLFSRNHLLLAPLPLTRSGWNLIDPEKLAGLIKQRPPEPSQVHRSFADRATQRIGAEAGRCYRREIRGGHQSEYATLRHSYAIFRQRHADWLERDALYEILKNYYGEKNWPHWGESETARLDRQLFAPPPDRETAARKRISTLHHQYGEAIEDYCFTQYLLAEQHQALQTRCRRLGLKLFGDCQIGLSERDAWFAQPFLLPGYFMGAPPSRTNPTGQPWSYPVLDPRRYDSDEGDGPRQPSPAVRFFRRRIDKLFAEFDGLRIDHPHGLICPWVYRADQEDQRHAVQNGARLFASPVLADHPDLSRFAIVRPDQLNGQGARFADDWVASLEADQLRRYASLFDVIMDKARKKGRGFRETACEILSTQPYPIKRVMEFYGQGRFRVTQKADLDNPLDVYRSENARPEDWLMLGNHDTAPIWRVAAGWLETGAARQQASYLADRLRIPERARTDWVNHVSTDGGALVQAKFADLFVGPSRNVMVYFTDLLGMLQAYNRPGTISVTNWSLRVTPDYKRLYQQKSAQHLALNIPGALAMALRSRGEDFIARHRELLTILESTPLAINPRDPLKQ